eukprot:g6493.t1
MVFGRKKGFLSSWTSSRTVETEPDLEFKATAHKLEAMHTVLAEIHFNIQLYVASWHAMCQASRAIAVGLAKLARDGGSGGDGGGDGADADVGGKKRVSSLAEMAKMYRSAQNTIDGLVREPTQRVVEDTTLRETGTLLSRFPPIFGKIARRKQLLVDVEAAKARVKSAEAAKEKEKDSFSVVAGNEHRRRMASALASAVSATGGLTAEVIADADRLDRERRTMLVPQVSALVGCQAYFMRRSAAVLERLAERLPYSAVALCRLMRPGNLKTVPATSRKSAGAPRMLHHTSSSSTVPVDASGHSVDSSSKRATTTAVPPPLPSRSDRRDSLEPKPKEAGVSPGGVASSSRPSRPPPPPPPPIRDAGVRRSSSSSSSSSPSAAKVTAGLDGGGGAASSALRLVEPQTGGVGEVAVEAWGATGRDDDVDEEVVW